MPTAPWARSAAAIRHHVLPKGSTLPADQSHRHTQPLPSRQLARARHARLVCRGVPQCCSQLAAVAQGRGRHEPHALHPACGRTAQGERSCIKEFKVGYMEELNSSKLASGSTQSWPLWGACPACTAGGGSKAARRRAPAAGLRYSWQACAAPTCAIQLATVCCTHSPLVSWRRGQSTVLRESADAMQAQHLASPASKTCRQWREVVRCQTRPPAQQCCCGAACTCSPLLSSVAAVLHARCLCRRTGTL